MDEWCKAELVRAFDVVILDGEVSRVWGLGAKETIGLQIDRELVCWDEREGLI
jgi:hypothetical protein